MEWSSGYVADINYTYGYYAGLNPLNLELALLYAGVKPPKINSACELGFGQGISINFHSAGSSISWCGNDFNPTHAGFANEVNLESESGAHLSDDDFEGFCQQPELPDFDFIGLHGVWSWISEKNRAIIVEFIKRKLRVGGVVYVSYNSQNAWANMIPLRDLMTYYASVMEPSGSGRIGGINGALEFAEKLSNVNPQFFKANGILKGRLTRLKKQNREYLAHEYFNKDWEAVNFAKLNDFFSAAKLSFVAPANHLEAINKINLTDEQQDLLNDVSDPILYQVVKDFCVNQQFRAEYWVKGPRKLSEIAQKNALANIRVMLIQNKEDITLKTKGALGEVTLKESVYLPILEYLSDLKPRTIGEIEQEMVSEGIDFAKVTQSIMVLIGKKSIAVVQEEKEISKAKEKTDRINKYLIEHAYGSKEIAYLVSPATAGGIPLNRIQKMFLAAIKAGKKTPKDWAEFAWKIISSQNQRIVNDGKEISTAEESINHLTKESRDFSKKQIPILKALNIM